MKDWEIEFENNKEKITKKGLIKIGVILFLCVVVYVITNKLFFHFGFV